jgi:TnpA family transposase
LAVFPLQVAKAELALNLVNAKYGNAPGLKAYTHVSDQFAPFAIQTIPATVSEAPYILDGLLMTDAGRRVRERLPKPADLPIMSSR